MVGKEYGCQGREYGGEEWKGKAWKEIRLGGKGVN